MDYNTDQPDNMLPAPELRANIYKVLIISSNKMLEYLTSTERRELFDFDRAVSAYASPTRYLETQGGRLVYFTIESADSEKISLVVPGIVEGKEYKTENGLPAVKVRPITKPAKQERICKKLESPPQDVFFWDNGEATQRVLSSFRKES